MKYFIFFLITFSASLLQHPSPHSYVVIWNVGQGQWVSAVTPTSCHHFDAGGEFFPWKKIFRSCSQKRNILFLSHWDWDHLGALAKPQFHKLKDPCVALRPTGVSSVRKMELLKTLSSCDDDLPKNFRSWSPRGNLSSNAQSHVVLYKDILLPGDSPSSQEKTWNHLSWIRNSRVLVLGHHGSATSTSQELLTSLPGLKLSISSARWARYKHPHSSTEFRLHKARVPLLRTEDWGNIWIEE